MSPNFESSGHLLRSGAEIARVLEALAAQRAVVTAQLRSDVEQFSSNLIHADPVHQFIVIATA